MSITHRVLGEPGRDNAVLATVNTGQSQHRLLFDCGEGCLNMVPRSDIQTIEVLFFSHFHIDHVAGFDSFFRSNWYRSDAPVRIFGPEGTHLKVRFADFRTITRSQRLGEPTAATEQLSQVACHLLATRLPRERQPVRLLGVGVSDIDRSGQTQRHLFDQQEYEQQARLDRASDSIKERFGGAALRRASALEHGAQHRAQPRPNDEAER